MNSHEVEKMKIHLEDEERLLHKRNIQDETSTHLSQLDKDNLSEEKNQDCVYREVKFCSTFKTLLSLLMINIFFFIFNNAQLTVILAFANNKYDNDVTLTTALGTVNTVLNLIIYPLIFGFAAVIEILGSQSYGAKRYYVFGCFLNRARLLGYWIIITVGFAVTISHDKLFNIWGLKQNIRQLAFRILMIRLASILCEFETYLMLRYIQIKNKGSHGIWILSMNGILLVFYCYIFIYRLNLYAFGCGLVYLANNCSIILTLWTFILVNCFDSKVLFFFNKDTFTHFSHFFKFFVPLTLLSFMDIFSSETMSIVANYFDKKLYAAYLNSYSIYCLIGTLSTAFNIGTNILISTSIGFGNGENTKSLFKHVLYIAVIFGSSVCFIFYTLCDQILSIIVEPGEIYDMTKKMIYIAIMCNFVDIVTYVLNSSMKALGQVYLTLVIYVVSNIINFFLIHFFAFKTSMGIYGIFYGYFINDVLLLFIYAFFFYFFVDFEKCALAVKENMEEYNEHTLALGR